MSLTYGGVLRFPNERHDHAKKQLSSSSVCIESLSSTTLCIGSIRSNQAKYLIILTIVSL